MKWYGTVVISVVTDGKIGGLGPLLFPRIFYGFLSVHRIDDRRILVALAALRWALLLLLCIRIGVPVRDRRLLPS